jgi:hypothetical protein
MSSEKPRTRGFTIVLTGGERGARTRSTATIQRTAFVCTSSGKNVTIQKRSDSGLGTTVGSTSNSAGHKGKNNAGSGKETKQGRGANGVRWLSICLPEVNNGGPCAGPP